MLKHCHTHGIRLPARKAARPTIELLESRQMLSAAILRPDHVVVVIEEDRFAGAVGDSANLPYFNSLVSSALVYTNAHGVAHPSEPNYLALYSGSTQGVTDNNTNHNFNGTANLASQLNSTKFNGQYMSFRGYSENLPANGDTTTTKAGDPNNHSAPPDLYLRNYNPMAMFNNVGTRNGVAVANSAVNLRFDQFPTTSAGFTSMANVSFVIPNNLHNSHGSNEQPPFATDPGVYNQLRQGADTWLQNNINSYLQWATTHNSLLIIASDEEETDSRPTTTITTLVTGDPRLFVTGTNATSINHFNLVRTLEDMYGLSYLGNAASASDLPINTNGQLAQALPAWLTPDSSAVWNQGSKILTVTGAATISADPGTDQPNIVATSAAAQLTIAPSGGGVVKLGNVTLQNGAGIVLTQTPVPLAAVIVVNGTIDTATGRIDLTDGGMIVNPASGDPTGTLETAIAAGRNGGLWDGRTGITSSTAQADRANHHAETNAVGIARNGSLLSPKTRFGGQIVTSNSVLLRYTIMGDADLTGTVDDDDVTALGLYYDQGLTTNHHWWQGDLDGNKKVDDDDVGLLGLFYGGAVAGPTSGSALVAAPKPPRQKHLARLSRS